MGAQATRLSDLKVKAAKPKEKDYTLTDGNGLQMRVRINGSKLELLADVFTDALELAAAGTLGAVRLVKYQRARQFGRQRRSLGLLP